MQSTQSPMGIEANANALFKQENTEANGFNNMSTIYENPTNFNSFMSPSNSSSSTFNNPQSTDKISSVVSMLKGTLERKKLVVNEVDEKEAMEESSLGYYSAAQVLSHACFNQEQGIHSFENQETFQDLSKLGDDETRALQTIEESLMEGIMGPTQMSTVSREPSQSESSAAVVSNGFEMFEDPCISAQAPTVCESSRNNQIGTEDYSRSRGIFHDIN